MNNDYKWYLGTSDECYNIGVFDTKEDALQKATSYDEPVYLCRAKELHLSLADYVSTSALIDNAEDNIPDECRSEYGDDYFFDLNDEQRSALDKVIKEAINRWQSKHSLVFESHNLHKVSDEQIIYPINKTQ